MSNDDTGDAEESKDEPGMSVGMKRKRASIDALSPVIKPRSSPLSTAAARACPPAVSVYL